MLSPYAVNARTYASSYLLASATRHFAAVATKNAKGHGGYVDETGVPRLNVLELHHAIRSDSQTGHSYGKRIFNWRRQRVTGGL